MHAGSVKELRWALLGVLSLLVIALLCIATVAEFGWVIVTIERNQGLIVAVGGTIMVYLIFDRK